MQEVNAVIRTDCAARIQVDSSVARLAVLVVRGSAATTPRHAATTRAALSKRRFAVQKMPSIPIAAARDGLFAVLRESGESFQHYVHYLSAHRMQVLLFHHSLLLSNLFEDLLLIWQIWLL